MAVCHYSDSPLAPYYVLMPLRRSDNADEGPPEPRTAPGGGRDSFAGASFIR